MDCGEFIMCDDNWYFEYCNHCNDIFKYAKDLKRKYIQGWLHDPPGTPFIHRMVLMRCSNCLQYNQNPLQRETREEIRRSMDDYVASSFIAKYGHGIDVEELR